MQTHGNEYCFRSSSFALKLQRQSSARHWLRLLPLQALYGRSQRHFEPCLHSMVVCTASSQDSDVFPLEREETEESSERRLKSRVLLTIATAGEKVEEAIRIFSDDIDEEMVAMLDERIKAARRMNEQENAIVGLVLLKRKLQAELQYRNASPSMRLLNEVMSLMPPNKSLIEDDELDEDIEIMLQFAFRPAEAPHVDIFGTALRVARGEEVEPIIPNEEGHVPKAVFIKETQDFLFSAAKNVMAIGKAIAKQRKLGKQEPAQEHEFNMRSIALDQIDHVLEIAKRI